jgi:hypothetical protein
MVSTDQDCPLFTPLGQVLPLFLEEQQITADCPNCEYYKQRAQLWRDEAYKQAGHPLPEREKDEPYAFEAFMYSNDRVKIDPVTGNVSIGTPQQEAKDEPVLWMMPDGKTADKWALQFYGGQKGKPLYTTPPQRTWVGLTDAEVDQAFTELTLRKIYQAIEAKLKDKNHDHRN